MHFTSILEIMGLDPGQVILGFFFSQLLKCVTAMISHLLHVSMCFC